MGYSRNIGSLLTILSNSTNSTEAHEYLSSLAASHSVAELVKMFPGVKISMSYQKVKDKPQLCITFQVDPQKYPEWTLKKDSLEIVICRQS